MLLCAYPMAQAASRWLVIAEARVQSQGSPWTDGHWDTFFPPTTLVLGAWGSVVVKTLRC